MADDSKEEDNIPAARALEDISCCARCVLRLLGERDISLYVNPQEKDVKRTCVACLGILEKSNGNTYIDKIQSSVTDAEHQFENFMFTISLPHSVILRQSPFKISLDFTYEDGKKELEFLNYESSKSRPRQRRKRQKYDPVTVTAAGVKKACAELTTVNLLKRVADCPPKSAQSPSELSEITCSHDSIHIAGRYNKYSRALSQTPWIINNVRHCESSVEEKICDLITAKVKPDDHKFASAGREDIDVRMLGYGRPFLVEFINPRVTRLSRPLFADLQKEINSSSADIAVRDLQQVTKEQCLFLKDAETNKTKTYKALIWTEEEVSQEQLQKLANEKDLKIFQKTPLRVLHRRPLAVRERYIYNMTPELIDSHYFNLFLKTQAGTYVKEFVHGDFGRTKPSLGDLLKTETDILQLDVESVDVDWPPRTEETDELKNSS
ncbi:Putative tRNA pseudouridine synthase Pus10 [Desmophyllum pertusum]|uniref:tRNA pseudouridine(55) synthase n=1 Tax=Desmophyllum pertusum TaxID=174260 RepID=A0A9X0CUA4_9CNID|nr:Putative tRNA pseudouridine synthase Pus10 [Desmophyllum pertusum]